jgi:ABC-type amino acid transport system permease subunit
MAAADPASSALPSLGDDLRAALRHAAIGVAAGAVTGLVVGGILGRIAMLILRLTTGDHITGVVSDDGFVMGRVTLGGSLQLAAAYTVIGVVLGLLYALARRFLPRLGRVVAWSAVTAALGGASFVHADGVDYALLEPLWLAVAFFVALPALAGLCVAWLVERIEARQASFGRRHAVVGLASLLLIGPAVVGALLLAFGRQPALRRLADATPVRLLALAVVAALTVAGGAAIVEESQVILAR